MVPPWARMLTTQGPEVLIPDQQPVTVTGLLKRLWGHCGGGPLTTERCSTDSRGGQGNTQTALHWPFSCCIPRVPVQQPFLHWLVCHLNTFILSLCMVISAIRHHGLCEVASALPLAAHWLQYRPSRDTVWYYPSTEVGTQSLEASAKHALTGV